MLIFCYGSNMLSVRLKQRISSSRKVGIGKLDKHILKFQKIGTDNSGKCDIHYSGKKNDIVWGVVIEIDPSEKPVLDTYEDYGRGYSDKIIEVELETGVKLNTLAYFAILINSDLKPFDWYKDFVIVGAIENKLPPDYIKNLKLVESIPDPDFDRSQKNRAILYTF